MLCAASIPADGIEALQLGSSPLASHCVVLAADGGSALSQYSIPSWSSIGCCEHYIDSYRGEGIPERWVLWLGR